MYIKIEDLADLLEVHRTTLWRWVKEGNIPTQKDSRTPRVGFRALMNYLCYRRIVPFKHTERPADTRLFSFRPD